MSRGYEQRVSPLRASLCRFAPVMRSPVSGPAALRGIRYEKKAQAELERRYGPEYVPGPWFVYELPEVGRKLCQCDGLLINPKAGRITIVEIKLQHTIQALRQMANLYEPVVRATFGDWEIAFCEVVKWFDCAVKGDVPVRLRSDVDLARPGEFAVHVFNPHHKFKH